jgi:hypothetical protein
MEINESTKEFQDRLDRYDDDICKRWDIVNHGDVPVLEKANELHNAVIMGDMYECIEFLVEELKKRELIIEELKKNS